MHRALHGGAAHETNAVQQRAQIADVQRCILAIKTNIGQGLPGSGLGGAGHHGLELGLGNAQVAGTVP